MRKSTLLAATAGLALVAGTAGPAAAIKYGEPDNGKHPYVGLMVAYVEDPTGALQPAWRCTGTQMDADTFLTAGHCTFGADAVAIWFGEDLTDAAAVGYPDFDSADATGTPFTNPDYDDAAFYLHDVGVVQLDSPVDFDKYGTLPTLDYWGEQIDTARRTVTATPRSATGCSGRCLTATDRAVRAGRCGSGSGRAASSSATGPSVAARRTTPTWS